MIWNWEDKQMIEMIKQVIQLRYHPKEWKQTQTILLKKGEKQDLTLVKSYRVISLLNCINKVLEKVIAEQLLLLLESFSKLHPGQMGA